MIQSGGLDPRLSPRLLVSVRDAHEADLVARAGSCLVDAKDPGLGALGALPVDTVRAIVDAVGRRSPTSAVAGEPETWADAVDGVLAMRASGVDMIKVAWPRQGEPSSATLARLRALPCPVVAVFFAEDEPNGASVVAALQAGFSGAMIDTRHKDGRTLLDHLAPAQLAVFIEACRGCGMMAGLAGSLGPRHVADLAPLCPSYIGMRGGLCRSHDRQGELDGSRIAEVLSMMSAGAPATLLEMAQ